MQGVDDGRTGRRAGLGFDQVTVFEVLRSPERRTLLTELEVAREYNFAELTTVLAERQGQESEQAQAALYHIHLPKLDHSGVVNWDRERGVVSLSEEGKRITSLGAQQASDD